MAVSPLQDLPRSGLSLKSCDTAAEPSPCFGLHLQSCILQSMHRIHSYNVRILLTIFGIFVHVRSVYEKNSMSIKVQIFKHMSTILAIKLPRQLRLLLTQGLMVLRICEFL